MKGFMIAMVAFIVGIESQAQPTPLREATPIEMSNAIAGPPAFLSPRDIQYARGWAKVGGATAVVDINWVPVNGALGAEATCLLGANVSGANVMLVSDVKIDPDGGGYLIDPWGFSGPGNRLTNLITPVWTNQVAYLVSGVFKTVTGMGLVSVGLTITNNGYAVLSNATTGYALTSRNYSGSWTNDDNLQLPVNNGDSIVFTNYGGNVNVNLRSSQFAGLKMP